MCVYVCVCAVHQAKDAHAAGVSEIVALLQRPEDLARLPDLRADYHNK